jgi:hypothetical protein
MIMGFSFCENEKFLGQLRDIRLYNMEELCSMELTNSITSQWPLRLYLAINSLLKINLAQGVTPKMF